LIIKKFPDIIIIDIPRSSINEVSYKSIEGAKDFLVFNLKYVCGMVTGKTPPHVIILANYPPGLSNLSKDRWIVLEITEQRDLRVHTSYDKTLREVSCESLTDKEEERMEKERGHDFIKDIKYHVDVAHAKIEAPKCNRVLSDHHIDL